MVVRKGKNGFGRARQSDCGMYDDVLISQPALMSVNSLKATG